LGLSLIFAGAWLRLWSIRYSGYRVRGKKFEAGLAISGPYSHVRNPLYIGNILMLMGMSFLSELLWLTPIVVVFSLFSYTCVSIYEEKELLPKQYGWEYEKYTKAVRRWIPRCKPYKKASPFFPWIDVIKTEIGAIAEVIAIITACAIKELLN
ncbi:MAG TPA: isoprenylcysteine carboxylmethyltransferase family protein, partial [Candidatus Omnitrophica bacterium]|nr:isoprenylcysteine carboxylmethyltransferase family protein [Candidatus Omnitrophota bacterium]